MWRVVLKVKKDKLPETLGIIVKKLHFPDIEKIKRSGEYYLVTFVTLASLKEIIQVCREEDLLCLTAGGVYVENRI